LLYRDMPKGLRETNSRIKSVKSTSQITRAMQLVASSKMRRAQETALAGRDYGRLFTDILDSALAGLGDTEEHPLLRPREIRVRGILLVTTDKGLCGALNANLFRLLADIPADAAKFVAVGRKGSQHLARARRDLVLDYSVSDRVNFSEVRPIANRLLELYKTGVVDTVEILYPRFKNTLVQEAVLQRILPVADIRAIAREIRRRSGAADTGEGDGAGGDTDAAAEIIFEPGATEVLAELPELYVKHAVYHAILEAKASEHSARMVAMKAATDNAQKITESLTLEYNKARQAAITQEINEITAAVFTH
jgi:F-type H+-transporting ATPase subunit gamma